MIKLILADDHKLVRDGLKAMLEEAKRDIQIIGEAASGKQLINMLPESQVDVVLMDIDMPEINGLEATTYITAHFPHIHVLMLSMMEQEKYITEAIQAGARGYLLKTTDQAELVHAIQTIARGELYISTQIAMRLLKIIPSTHPGTVSPATEAAAPQTTPNELTKREMEVLGLIAQGYTNIQIGELLFTSKRTVESHRQSLLEKTGSKNTAALIVYASKYHLLDEKDTGAGS